MTLESDDILFFKDEYKIYSNFYIVEVVYDGDVYPTVEHAFQAAKTLSDSIRKQIRDIPADEAGKAKIIGRKLKLRPEWDLLKISVMRRLLERKFSVPEFENLLISTGNRFMEEGNYWHDNYWGNCHCKKCQNIKGLNNLGKLLMKIRKKMIDEKL